MREQELKDRTKRLVVEVAKLLQMLPRGPICQVYVKQLARCSSSVAANYRSACRARSDAEMVARFGIVEDEADESQFWIEIILETGYSDNTRLSELHKEFGEIVAIMVASRRTLQKRIGLHGSSIRETRNAYNLDPTDFDDE